MLIMYSILSISNTKDLCVWDELDGKLCGRMLPFNMDD